MSQPQYTTEAELQSLAITPAAGVRFGSTAMVAALQAASSIADSYLSSQFVLPLVSWDMSLRLHVANIAAWLLYCQFGFAPTGNSADKVITDRYDRAIAWLDSISKKTVTPVYVDSSGTAAGSDAAGDFIITDSPVGFTSRGTPVSDPWGWGTW